MNSFFKSFLTAVADIQLRMSLRRSRSPLSREGRAPSRPTLEWLPAADFFPKILKRVVVIICLSGSTVSLLGEDPGQKRKIDLPVPIGHDVTGLHVPMYNADGKMELQLNTESARRLDANNVQMKSVGIQTFDVKTGKPDLKIELKTANLNTDTNIVTSDEPVRVTRSDFELTGNSMEFAHDTRQAILKGDIHMLIYNRQTIQSKSQPIGQQQ
jgi:hypothetical protein